MKRLLYLTLVLLAVLLTGCMVANGDETLLLSTTAAAMTTEAPVTEPPTTAAPTTEPPVNLEGVEMVLYASSAVTPDQPAARLVVSIPQAELPGAADRLASLTLTLDGEEAGSWPELELEPGLEVETELTFSFERYQPDRTAAVVFTLSRGEDTLVCETAVELRNDPDEVYAQRSGDPRPYQIDVVRNHNVVIIYGKDEDGEYTVPVKAWLCSTGWGTHVGNFSLGNKRVWGYLFGGVCGQYACNIEGNVLFHSVPYYRTEKNSLKTLEYNKLGTACSMGCVRLPVVGAKWIFDNCPTGSPIHIYDAEELPVERPEQILLDPDDPRSGWDPTDPDPENPWLADN